VTGGSHLSYDAPDLAAMGYDAQRIIDVEAGS
jgi:hypothetical protein